MTTPLRQNSYADDCAIRGWPSFSSGLGGRSIVVSLLCGGLNRVSRILIGHVRLREDHVAVTLRA